MNQLTWMFNLMYLSPYGSGPIRSVHASSTQTLNLWFSEVKNTDCQVCFLIADHVKGFIHPEMNLLSSFIQACILWNTKADV